MTATGPRSATTLSRPRGLCPQLLGRCLTSSILYADQRSNAVFLCRNSSGTVTGAEIVGIAPLPRDGTFKGMAPGSRKSKGGFWLPTDTSEPLAVLLTESAIDSLSAYQLLAPTLPPQHPHHLHRPVSVPLFLAGCKPCHRSSSSAAMTPTAPEMRPHS